MKKECCDTVKILGICLVISFAINIAIVCLFLLSPNTMQQQNHLMNEKQSAFQQLIVETLNNETDISELIDSNVMNIKDCTLAVENFTILVVVVYQSHSHPMVSLTQRCVVGWWVISLDHLMD